MSTSEKKTRWEEEEEEENTAPVTGVKELITYTTNAKGQNVRVTTKVKVTEVKHRVPKRVAARKNLPRFGDAKSGEENVTLRSPDFVFMEHPSDQIAEDAADPSLAKTLANFIQKQQERKLTQAITSLDAWGASDAAEPAAEIKQASSGGPSKYVAPGSRPGGASAIMSGGGPEERSEDTTLRVSNLSKATTEDDLRDLFGRFGHIYRLSLPKNDNGEPRGYAYVSFSHRLDAEKAMEKLNGFGYDHLILKLEWAKPSKGSMNSTFQSGYGKALAQDSKQQATYFSQHNR